MKTTAVCLRGRCRATPLLCTVLAATLLLLAQPATSALNPAGAAAPAAGPAAAAAAAANPAWSTPLWQHWNALFPLEALIPTVTMMRGHEVVYQVPASPVATLFIAHGCAHTAHDWWPQSDACPICLGLPEEVAHTQQALARNYAVIAMSSNNTHGDNCMDWGSNHQAAVDVLNDFLKAKKLEQLPLYGLGVSVGGGFVLKLTGLIKFDGVLSEVLGPAPQGWDPAEFEFGMPPAVFIAMDRDWGMAARISADYHTLLDMGVPAATVRVAPRPVYPTFFSDRSPRITPEVSVQVVSALRQIGMLDDEGMVTHDPRHSHLPWVATLLEMVPDLAGGLTPDHSQVWEEMNVAWSMHEIIADFATAAFIWFESGGTANFSALMSQHAPPGSGIVADPATVVPPAFAGLAEEASKAPQARDMPFDAAERKAAKAAADLFKAQTAYQAAAAAAAAASAPAPEPERQEEQQLAVLGAAAPAAAEGGSDGAPVPALAPLAAAAARGVEVVLQSVPARELGALVTPQQLGPLLEPPQQQQQAAEGEGSTRGSSSSTYGASLAADPDAAAARAAATADAAPVEVQGPETAASAAPPAAGAGHSVATAVGAAAGAAAAAAALLLTAGFYALSRRRAGFAALPTVDWQAGTSYAAGVSGPLYPGTGAGQQVFILAAADSASSLA